MYAQVRRGLLSSSCCHQGLRRASVHFATTARSPQQTAATQPQPQLAVAPLAHECLPTGRWHRTRVFYRPQGRSGRTLSHRRTQEPRRTADGRRGGGPMLNVSFHIRSTAETAAATTHTLESLAASALVEKIAGGNGLGQTLGPAGPGDIEVVTPSGALWSVQCHTLSKASTEVSDIAPNCPAPCCASPKQPSLRKGGAVTHFLKRRRGIPSPLFFWPVCFPFGRAHGV
eukprot:COSAG01_NODE_1806_length_9192_cov_11.433410_8_plen_229_part_00